ncbi:sigma-70 family RNA polymerase sigma factor [Paludisphaera mucosa]|uniref:Sigma-70 family RNA polymerase sigma factor n=1 Tax=Paludisphaera mucosa TaxID=3030827 RepID=A0ABT6FAY1_9BACT|nr:sigma-70 family RNA polymerase sigma factor [Paludisphaera mucosa]MDG3004594.1 sigma-70 family RNA polymerase sigma factor [Paludisphaera mucosa]
MAEGSAARRDLATLFRSGTAVGLTDGEVLRRVGRGSAEEAGALFEAIVERHGAMVLRVCRGVLGDAPDADDAFQATFLVLARRLCEARRLESVGGWLHGVAARVSARARVDAARRRRHEIATGKLAVVECDPVTDPDRDRAVQEEVGRLPQRYREVVVLCFWEGLTHEQAAGRIGCPLGTVRSRSARARDLLRRRLMRRGLAPEGREIEATSPPAVPDALATSAARGATEAAAGRSALGVVGVHAIELSHRVSRRMIMMKFAAISLASSLALVTAAGLGRAGFQEAPAEAPPARQPGAAAVPPRLPYEEYVVEPPDILLVEVLEALEGRPISGERLIRPDGRITLGFYGDVSVAGLTIREAKGKIVLHLRKFLGDDVLGLFEPDPKTGERTSVDPRDSARVFVDVTTYNSKKYYVLGSVKNPGGIPVTGSETVLDAVYFAGGLLAEADPSNLTLVRNDPKTGRAQKWTIDLDRITSGEDISMNRQLRPGDRLMAVKKASPASRAPNADGAAADGVPPRPGPSLDDLDRRLSRVESRLDAFLKKIGD